MAAAQQVEPKLPYEGKFWTIVAPLARHYIKKLYGPELARKAYKGGKPLYRELIDRAPAIGAGNPMAKNLYLSCVIFAMWKACDGELTSDMMREVLRALFASRVVRSAAEKGDLRKPENMAKLNESLHACAAWTEERPAIKDATWQFHFDDDRGGTIAHYHYTRCPINDLARQEGLMEILPVMCETDYLNLENKHARFTREHTLAEDGPYCDFLIEPGE